MASDDPVACGAEMMPLREGQALVVVVELDAAADSADSAILDEDERRRAARLPADQRRQRWITAHVVMRQVLGRILGREAASLRFVIGSNGRPRLTDDDGCDVNLSHSGPLALIALARDRQVGVDIEHVRPCRDPLAVAERFFTGEEHAVLQTLPADQVLHAFLRVWTAKEAVVKALGLGMAAMMGRFAVEAHPQRPLRLIRSAPGMPDLSLHPLEGMPGTMATLAIAGGPATIRTMRWP
jgi:4'-phosphopantetheinyl transferase